MCRIFKAIECVPRLSASASTELWRHINVFVVIIVIEDVSQGAFDMLRHFRLYPSQTGGANLEFRKHLKWEKVPAFKFVHACMLLIC